MNVKLKKTKAMRKFIGIRFDLSSRKGFPFRDGRITIEMMERNEGLPTKPVNIILHIDKNGGFLNAVTERVFEYEGYKPPYHDKSLTLDEFIATLDNAELWDSIEKFAQATVIYISPDARD